MKIHRLSLTTRDRTPRLKSILTVLAGAGIRATATFGVAAAALVPVGGAPAPAVISCPGGAVTWEAIGDGNWSDGSNWSGGVPTAGDDACIPSGVTVTIDSSASVRQLVSEGTLDIQGLTTLTVGAASETNGLDLHGTIAGAGSLAITGSGSWTGGTIATSVEVAGAATLNILGTNGSSPKVVTGTLTNNGTVDQPGTHVLLLSSGGGVQGTIINNGDWYFTNPGTGFTTIHGAGFSSVGTFVNNGVMERRDGTGEVELTASVNIENHGTINASSGILKINSVTAIGDGARMSAESGAILRMRAKASTGATVTGLSTISGTGVVEWFDGNQAVFNLATGAVVDVQSGFELNGAEIAGPGKLSISGTGSWQKGTVSGNLEVTSTGTLTILGTGSTDMKLVTGSLTNHGTVIQPGARLETSTSSTAGTITNHGLWQLTNPGSNFFTIRGDASNPGSFVNNNTLERIGASSPAQVILLAAGVEVTNNGTVVARFGELWIGSAPSHYAGTTLSNGTWVARGGSRLVFPSTFTESDANLLLSGPGSSFGYLAGPFDVRPLNAFTTNTGTFRLAESADFATGSDFANNGNLVLGNATAVSDASTLAVNGAFVTTGTLEIQVGGVSTDHLYGEITATGAVTLSGTLRATLLNGFTPNNGDSYQVMVYPSVSGTFGIVDIEPFFDHTVTGGGVFLTGIDPIPIADAGGPYDVDEGSTIGLDGSESVDLGTGTITSYDWQPASSFVDNTIENPTFTAAIDDGPIAVTLEVCDDATPDVQCHTDAATVNVINVAPAVTASSGTLTLNEGAPMPPATLAAFSDPGVDDTHTVTIDWGDGNSEGVGATSPVIGAHTYIQDGSYTITVTVLDDDGGSGEATKDVTVANVSPSVDITEASVTGNVGDTITIHGIYTDPGSADTHTANIEWRDGTSDIDVAVTGNMFSFSHAYTTAVDDTIRVCIVDDSDDTGCDTVDVSITTAQNVAPDVDAGGEYVTDEGNPVAITGTATDTDPLTTAWTSTPGGSFAAAGSQATTFTADQDGTYTITLTATDSFGLSTSDTAKVTVNNVAPSIDSLQVDTGIPEGSTASLNATFSDPGALDTHTATIDWGEGAPPVPARVTGHAVAGSNLYELAGTYTVELCITDDDATTCRSARVEVTETLIEGTRPIEGTPPTADPGGPYRGREGSKIRLNGKRSSDADGRIVSYRWTATGGSFDNPHKARPKFRAPDDGTYTLTLEVTDNDGLTDSATTTVKVDNVDPRVEAGPDTNIRAGENYRLKAKFDDRGKSDTHIATVDWGDGSRVTVVDPAKSPIRLKHKYAKPGRYTVTVTVVDDDGGSDTDDLVVTASIRDKRRRHDDDRDKRGKHDDGDDDRDEHGKRDDDDDRDEHGKRDDDDDDDD